MAFHVACPITCRRICFCTLGFPEKLQREQSRNEFLEEVFRVEELLSDPLLLGDGGKGTVQVLVPRISPAVATAAATVEIKLDGAACGDGEEILSARTKRVAMQRKAVAASLAAEDYARRFENGDFADASGEVIRDIAGEAQGSSTVKVVCRICYYGENEGSSKAMKMLSCKICSKKYHRNCLKSWAEYRDLFHWSSWVCPSCRICEVCRRAGDPNKFMFCKRCDGAYHCYCQQPPHKNVTAGPYLCPKHTRCHSCASTVSGSGLSTRWFLGYTFCDACGRLFVKGNYCPVCLKVYRDSESTPMVCCDECQRWVHCRCDGISDEKYQQFQVDKNLYYKCAACRGDCYQIRDLDDAVRELWRRRDKADRDQIASLRAAAGLPSQEEIFSISPYTDDEENNPVILKNEYGRSLKFSLKGLAEKPIKSSKEYGKKSSKTNKKYVKKKGYQAPPIGKTEEVHQSFEGLHETRSLESSLGDEKTDDRSYRAEGPDIFSQLTTRSPDNKKEKSSINQPVIANHSFIGELVGKDKSSRVVPIKSSKYHVLDLGEGGTTRHASKAETVKGTKLVIHLAARNRNVTNSPKSEGSSCHREQDLLVSNGSEDNEQQKANDKENCMLDTDDGMGRYNDGKGVRFDSMNPLKVSKHKGKESSLIKLGKVKPEVSEPNPKCGRENTAEECESTAVEKTPVILGKRSSKGSTTASEPEITFKHDEVPLRKHSKSNTVNLRSESRDSTLSPSVPDSILKDPKPLLKLKFKNPYLENRSSWIPQGEEEKSSIKGQRSKRKRPSPLMEKAPVREDENDTHLQWQNPLDEVMDASWILKKLGKDAIGKRVEVHQSSDNSWHKGEVTDSIENASAVAVLLDDGRHKTVELGKQAVRFISQKQKRTRT